MDSSPPTDSGFGGPSCEGPPSISPYPKGDLLFKKLSVLFTFVLAGFATLAVSLDQTSFNVDSNPVLIAPERAEVGELVRIHSGAEVVKWLTIPEVPDFQEFGTGSIAISFRSPGQYIIVASTYSGSNLSLEKKVITVGSPVPVPESKPLPPLDLAPTVKVVTLSSKISQWCSEANVPVAVAERLGNNFKKVSESLAVIDVATLLRETSSLNSLIPAGPHQQVLARVQAELLKSRLETLEQYKQVWQEVSVGFLSYKG